MFVHGFLGLNPRIAKMLSKERNKMPKGQKNLKIAKNQVR